MKFELRDFLIESDSFCYTLYKKEKRKKTTVAGKTTAPEKVGEEILVQVGYFPTIDSAMRRMGDSVVKENDDIEVVIEKLDNLEREIFEISNKLNLRVKIVE